MLVLSRKVGEVVAVGASVGADPLLTVTVIGIAAGKVKLGFEVRREMHVHRWEVWERIRNAEAGASHEDEAEREP